jgi:hypothetical protein
VPGVCSRGGRTGEGGERSGLRTGCGRQGLSQPTAVAGAGRGRCAHPDRRAGTQAATLGGTEGGAGGGIRQPAAAEKPQRPGPDETAGDPDRETFAHPHDTGGLRWVGLCGQDTIAQRSLIHAAALNLSLILRPRLGVGSARRAADLFPPFPFACAPRAGRKFASVAACRSLSHRPQGPGAAAPSSRRTTSRLTFSQGLPGLTSGLVARGLHKFPCSAGIQIQDTGRRLSVNWVCPPTATPP